MKYDLAITKLFLFGIFLSSLIFSPYVLDFTLTARYILLAAVLGLSCFILYRADTTVKVNIDLLLCFYICYTLFCCISIAWANTISEAIFESSKTVTSLLVFMFTVFSLQKHKTYFMATCIKLSLLLSLIIISAGIYQFSKIDHLNKEALYTVIGLNGHKNLFSGFLFLNLFFLLLSVLRSSGGLWKFFSILTAVLCLTTIFILKTKAVWIAAAVTVIVFFALIMLANIRKKINVKWNVYAVIISSVVSVNIFFLFILQPVIRKYITYKPATEAAAEVKDKKQELDDERLLIWDKTYYVFKKQPVIGVGMGNWQIHYPDATLTGLWRCEDLNVTFQRPHNDFLWIISEVGLIGFNLFLFFLIGLLVFLMKCITMLNDNNRLRTELILCASFIIGYFTYSFFDFPKERIEHLIWINIMMGIAYYHIKTISGIVPVKSLVIDQTACLILCIFLGFFVYVGALRYKGETCLKEMYGSKFAKNNNADAIRQGRSAISFAYTIDPTSVPVSWYIGNANAAMGNYKEAQEDFKNAHLLNPYNRNVINDLASSYVYTNNTEQAKKYYKESARISPRFDDPKLNLAALYIREENYEEAAVCLISLLHDSPRRSTYKKIVEANLNRTIYYSNQ